MEIIKLGIPITFCDAYENFKAFCIAKNLSKTTIIDYERIKKHLLTFMGTYDFELPEFAEDKVVEYIMYCKKQGNKDVSINTKLRHLRAIFNYCAKKDYCAPIEFKMLKTTKEIKDVYTQAELRLLLNKPDVKKCGFDEYRDWVMINFFLGTGCRLSTVTSVHISDININENEILLKHLKNRTQQIIPINSILKGILIEYLRFRKPKEGNDYLFCNWWGNQLSNSGCINSIRKYNRSRGVCKTSIHLFRHTFAKMFIMQGGDIFRLQKILGHKSLEMVRNYVEIYGCDLHRNFDDFNPLTFLINQKEHIKMKKY